MALQENDLAILTARFGCARFGASRFGFIPCPEDVHGAGFDEPGEYIWKEVKPPTTSWTLQTEDCVCGQRPVAAFSNILCNAVGPVVFTDTSTPAEQVTFWYWDFGDGNTSNEQNPTHVYAAGYFTVTLTVSSDIGSATAIGYVSVMSLSAGAAPNPAFVGEDVTFTPTLSGGLAPYTYLWEFEQDTLWDDLVAYYPLNEASGNRLNAAGLIGDLTPTAGVTAVAGRLYANSARIVSAQDDRLLYLGDLGGVSFALGATVAMWVKPTNIGVTPQYVLQGPCSLFTGAGSQTTVIFYGPSGTTCTATINSSFGGSVDGWVFVIAWWDPADGKAHLFLKAALSYLDTASADTIASLSAIGGVAVGGVLPVPCSGDYGPVYIFNNVLTAQQRLDLWANNDGLIYPGSRLETPVYAYPTDGAKVASLTVTSSTGCTATDTVDVTVNASTLAVTFTLDPDPTVIGVDYQTPITFTPDVTPGVAPYTYDWDWGDGEAHGTTEIPTHTYDGNALGGTYDVVLTVTDAALATATASQTIQIVGV